MRALSIRQPYAELILRGIKTAELRTISTRIVGERFYIYASKTRGQISEVRGQKSVADLTHLTSDNLAVQSPPDWMIELAEQVKMIEPGAILPTGVIVGTAIIDRVTEIRDQSSTLPSALRLRLEERLRPEGKSEISNRASGLTSDLRPLTSLFAWHLTDVKRAKTFRKPKGHPQPVWFRPF